MLRKIHQKYSKNEQGNIFVLYVMMFTLMLGIVGLGADTAMNTYARNSIQLSMDTATLTAATRTNTGNTVDPARGLYNQNTATLSQTQACTEVWNTYLKNRPGTATAGPVLVNQRIPGPNRPAKATEYDPVSCIVSKATRDGRTSWYVEAQVIEYRKNTFLSVLGIKEQKFVITSRSRLANSYETR